MSTPINFNDSTSSEWSITEELLLISSHKKYFSSLRNTRDSTEKAAVYDNISSEYNIEAAEQHLITRSLGEQKKSGNVWQEHSRKNLPDVKRLEQLVMELIWCTTTFKTF